MISYVTMNYCTYFYMFMSGRASKCFVCVSHFLPWFDPFLGPIRPSLNQVIIQVKILLNKGSDYSVNIKPCSLSFLSCYEI